MRNSLALHRWLLLLILHHLIDAVIYNGGDGVRGHLPNSSSNAHATSNVSDLNDDDSQWGCWTLSTSPDYFVGCSILSSPRGIFHKLLDNDINSNKVSYICLLIIFF